MDYAKMLLGQLGVLSGVPPYIWGAAPPDDETERVLFHGQAKVNSFGRGVEQLGQQVRFTSEPFITRKERVGA